MASIVDELVDTLDGVQADIEYLEKWTGVTFPARMQNKAKNILIRFDQHEANNKDCNAQAQVYFRDYINVYTDLTIKWLAGNYDAKKRTDRLAWIENKFFALGGNDCDGLFTFFVANDLIPNTFPLITEYQQKAKTLKEKREQATALQEQIAAATQSETDLFDTAADYFNLTGNLSPHLSAFNLFWTRNKAYVIVGGLFIATWVIYQLYYKKKSIKLTA